MKDEGSNIYRNARLTAGLTQERWAELLGITPQAVQLTRQAAICPATRSPCG